MDEEHCNKATSVRWRDSCRARSDGQRSLSILIGMSEAVKASTRTKRESATATTSATATALWKNLVEWVEHHANGAANVDGIDEGTAGFVHRSLELRYDHSNDIRGVFCTHPIVKGEILVRIPMRCTINGKAMPPTYTTQKGETRHVSTWLRCLAAYMRTVVASRRNGLDDPDTGIMTSVDDCQFLAYLASLPSSYETLWSWSEDQIDEFLAGTRTPTSASSNAGRSPTSWRMESVRQNYADHIRPYLIQCGVLPNPDSTLQTMASEEEIQCFALSCQALSSRGFYMESNCDMDAVVGGVGQQASQSYLGPYLIPVMDLLNHAHRCSTAMPSTCTSVQLVDNNFCMVAERDVLVGEEVLHSYGDTLFSSQFLASYGFIPNYLVQRAATHQPTQQGLTSAPISISKQGIWDCCWQIIESDIPRQIADMMKDMEDEVWGLKVDRSRKADYVPEYIVLPDQVQSDNDDAVLDNSAKNSLLTDEIVTAACVPFLPRCAYAEITERTLLDRSVLSDYFLGKLVGMALLRVIQHKMESYKPISMPTINRLFMESQIALEQFTRSSYDEVVLLQETLKLLSPNNDSMDTSASSPDMILRRERWRLAYGLTIRLEEKKVLQDLSNEIVAHMSFLDDSVGYCDDVDASVSKKRKSCS